MAFQLSNSSTSTQDDGTSKSAGFAPTHLPPTTAVKAILRDTTKLSTNKSTTAILDNGVGTTTLSVDFRSSSASTSANRSLSSTSVSDTSSGDRQSSSNSSQTTVDLGHIVEFGDLGRTSEYMSNADLLYIGAQFSADLLEYNRHIKAELETGDILAEPQERNGCPTVSFPTPLRSHVIEAMNEQA